MTKQEKYQKLQDNLRSLKSVAVAFSGGVDSTFLLKAAVDTLGTDKVIAVTACSCFFPEREQKEAEIFCRENGIRQIVFQSKGLEIDGIRQNPSNRCYLCKRALLMDMIAIAAENNINFVVEGSNMDDRGDYRPGMVAVKELGVISPLCLAEFYKAEIREFSKQFGLPTWDKPSIACLASRFAYGETISEERLAMVDKAEQRLLEIGFEQVRVRVHGQQDGAVIARIEVMPEEFSKLVEREVREQVYHDFKEIGFAYVALDLRGYRTGSMNETLESQKV